MGGPVPDIADVEYETERQLALGTERPALRVRRFHLGIEELDRLAEVGAESAGGSRSRYQAIGQRIRERRGIGDAIVQRSLDRGGLREAGLHRLEGIHADGAEENSVAAADYRLIVELVSQTDSRQPVVAVAIRAAAGAILSHKRKSALSRKGRGREFRNRILRVSGGRGRSYRAVHGRVKSSQKAVIAFRQACLLFEAESHVKSKFRREPEIVLQERAPVLILQRVIQRGSGRETASGNAQQHRRQFLTQ